MVISCTVAAVAENGPARFGIDVHVSVGFPYAMRAEKEAALVIDATTDALDRRFGRIRDRKGSGVPRAKLTVYRKQTDFERAIHNAGANAFEENLAVTDYRNRESHVAFQPAQTSAVMTYVGLPLLTRRQIAHEAAHLWCDARWPNEYRNGPRWLREGIPTWAAEQGLRSRGLIDRAEDDPFLSTRIVLAQRAVGRLRQAPSPSRTNDPFGAFDRGTRYAFDWLWTRMRIEKLMVESGGSDDGVSFDRLVEHLTTGPDATFAGLTRYVRSMRPEWEEVSRSLQVADGDYCQMAFPDVDAFAWHTTGPTRPAYTIRGTIFFWGKEGGQAGVHLARDAQGYLVVSFRPGAGVTISRFEEKSGAWTELARNTTFCPSTGVPCKFEIVVTVETLTVVVNSHRVVTAKVPGKRMSGPWGLAVQKDRSVRWENFEVVSDTD